MFHIMATSAAALLAVASANDREVFGFDDHGTSVLAPG